MSTTLAVYRRKMFPFDVREATYGGVIDIPANELVNDPNDAMYVWNWSSVGTTKISAETGEYPLHACECALSRLRITRVSLTLMYLMHSCPVTRVPHIDVPHTTTSAVTCVPHTDVLHTFSGVCVLHYFASQITHVCLTCVPHMCASH